jgi:hypothetical protein
MSITLTVTPNSLLSFLGFTNDQSGSTTITATTSYIFPFDEYISIWIENIGISSQDSKKCTYKIPMQPQTSNVIFWTPNKYNTQIVDNQNKQFLFEKLNISILDQYGNQLDNNGKDWSMTIETDVTGVCTR